MSLHFNDYLEKPEKNAYLVLKYKCYAQVLGLEEFKNFIFLITYYLLNNS